SPVRTESPAAKSISSRSIRTISRIDSLESISDVPASSSARQRRAHPRQPGPLVLLRRKTPTLQQRIGILVPLAVGITVPEDGGGGLCFGRQAHRVIGFGEAGQRLLDMPGVRIVLDDVAEARDGGDIFAALEIVAADLHFLAGELVAREADL